MNWGRLIPAAILMAVLPALAHAQTESLEVIGRVVRVSESGQVDPVSGRMVWLSGMQRFVFTQADGRFKLNQTEPPYRRGQIVEVRVSEPGWQIFEPVGGRILVPERMGGPPVLLRMAKVGQSVFLSDAAVSLFLRDAVFACQPPMRGTESSRPTAIDEAMGGWAQQYGIPLSQVQDALETWVAKRRRGEFSQPDERCLLPFVLGEIAQSAACFAGIDSGEDSDTEPQAVRSLTQAEQLLQHSYRAAQLYAALKDSASILTVLQNAARRIPREVAPLPWALLRSYQAAYLRARVRGDDLEQARSLLENAATAYRDALSVYTQASLPGQWADLQLQLGITLYRASLVALPERRAPLASESADALQHGLLVVSPERSPEPWANLKYQLALTRRRQADLAEGSGREALRRDAQACLRAAAPVYARLRRAGSYGQAMLELAEVCLELQDRACATASALAAYAADPKNHGTYGGVVWLLQERMFDTERVIAIHRDHAARYPEDLGFLANLAESLLQVGHFEEARQLIERAIPKAQPRMKGVLICLQGILQLAQGQRTEYGRTLSHLRTELAAQGPDFRLDWTFDSTAHFVRTDARMQPFRTQLLALMDALLQKNRDAILAAIDALPALP